MRHSRSLTFCRCELPCRSVECISLHCFNAQPYIFAVVNCADIALSVFSLHCFNVFPDIFAVVNCSVLALSAVFCSGLLTCSADNNDICSLQ